MSNAFSIKMFIRLALAFAMFGMVAVLAFLMPNTAEASCGSDEVLATDGNCYDADLYDPDDLCDAGYDEYCEDSGGGGDCDSDEVLASDGRCYDADLYDPDDLCDAGYSEYCDSGGSNNDEPESCSSGEVLASDGRCYDADLYDPQDLCDAGYREYCSSTSSTGNVEYDEDNWQEAASSPTWESEANCTNYAWWAGGQCVGSEGCGTDSRAQDGFEVCAETDFDTLDGDGTGIEYDVYFGEDEGCGFEEDTEQSGNTTYHYYTPIPEQDCEEEDGSNNSDFENNEEENNNEEDNTIPDQCTNISGYQSSVPVNCTRNSSGICAPNPGYQISGGQCVSTCAANQHYENGSCVSNTRACTITNGTGQQTWNGSSWGTCTVVSCNTGYQQQGNNCVAINSSGVYLIVVDDSAKEGGDTASFRVARGGSILIPLDVNLSFSGSAVRGVDYTVSGGGINSGSDNTASLGFNQSQSGLITLTALTDAGYEALETASISLAPSYFYSFGIPSRIDITIRDSRAALPTITSFYGDRVRSGNPSTLHWSISSIEDLACTISPDPTDDSGSYAVGSANGTVVTIPLLHQKLYTLGCSNGVNSISVDATVSILPAFEEI